MSDYVIVEVSHSGRKHSTAAAKEVTRILSSCGVQEILCKSRSAIYRLEGPFSKDDAENISRKLLCDPVIEKFQVNSRPDSPKTYFADVWYRSGVTDAVGESVLRAIKDLNISGVEKAYSGTRYCFSAKGNPKSKLNGGVEKKILSFVGSELLNPLVQECKITKF